MSAAIFARLQDLTMRMIALESQVKILEAQVSDHLLQSTQARDESASILKRGPGRPKKPAVGNGHPSGD